jgi:hypothetical protein
MAGPDLAADHPLDRAIALVAARADDPRCLSGATSEDYWNAVGPFGGVTAATLLNAVLLQPDRLGVPLSLTVSYAGAIRAGGFEIRVRLLRGGRTTQHWSVDLVQGPADEVMASALVACVLRRDTWGVREARPPAVAPAPESFGPRSGEFPRWLRWYREHLVHGELYRESPHSETLAWIADAPDRALDYPALAAICDAFFPRIYLRRPRPVPIATVSLNVYFHAGLAAMAAQGVQPVLAQASGQVFSEGFCDQEGRIWGAGESLLATTHQVVWYKE